MTILRGYKDQIADILDDIKTQISNVQDIMADMPEDELSESGYTRINDMLQEIIYSIG